METVVASDVAPIYDAVILTCMAYDLDTAVAAIGPAVAPTGYVLPFLNGIAHIDVLNQRRSASTAMQYWLQEKST